MPARLWILRVLLLVMALVGASCGVAADSTTPSPALTCKARHPRKLPPGSEVPVPPPGLPQGESACPKPGDAPAPTLPEEPLAPTQQAGAIHGAFSVSSTGEASYTIPLIAPPGRAGMTPSLALIYDSASGEGVAGVGFSVGGLSAITRCPKTLARDGEIREVRDDAEDVFCFDGRRLVQVGQTSTFVEYRTFPDTFVKVLAHYPAGWSANKGPEHFEVFLSSGQVLTLGGADEGKVLGKGGVLRSWLVTEARDRRNNTIAYHYIRDQHPSEGYTVEHAPSRIDYTAHPGAPASRAVVFQYVSRPPDRVRSFFARGMLLTSSRQLTSLRMLGPNDALVREYRMAYDEGPATRRSRLTKLEECGPDNLCKPPTRFGWTGAVPSFVDVTTSVKRPTHDEASVMPMDVDGDGLDDLVIADLKQPDAGSPTTRWEVAFNKANAPYYNLPKLGFGQDHADSALDPNNGIPLRPDRATPIDYNMDGRMDLLVHDLYGSSDSIFVLLAKPDGGFVPKSTGIPKPFPVGSIPPVGLQDPNAAIHLADVDGDGMSDLLLCSNDHPGGLFGWTLHRWTLAAFGFEHAGEDIPMLAEYPCNKQLFTVDVNGDGKVDLLALHNFGNGGFGDTFDAHSRAADGSWSATDTQLAAPSSGAANEEPGLLIFLDANGDGLPDAMKSGFQDHKPRIFFNTGRGFGPAVAVNVPNSIAADRLFRFAIPLDHNGDGLADLLLPVPAFDDFPSWQILESTGAVSGDAFTVVPTPITFSAQLDQEGISLADKRGPRVTDVDGDGGHDVVITIGSFVHVFKGNGGDQDLLSTVTDGMATADPNTPGHVPTVKVLYDHMIDKSITFEDATGSEQAASRTYRSREDGANTCSYPRRCAVGPRRVVRGFGRNNGADKLRYTQIRYRDGRYDRLGLGFLGFGSRIVEDESTGAVTIERYDNGTYDGALRAYPFAYRMKESRQGAPGLATQPHPERIELSYHTSNFTVVPTNGGATYFVQTLFENNRREQGTFAPGQGFAALLSYVNKDVSAPVTVLRDTTRTALNFDAFGNVLVEKSATIGVDLKLRVERTFKNNQASWILGQLLTEETCSEAAGDKKCRTSTFSRNGYGEVTKSELVDEAHHDETYRVIKVSRDGFGNVIKVTDQDGFGNSRVSCTSFTSDGIYPYAHKNPAGHLTFMKHHPGLGVLLSTQDPNGLVTSWQLDGLGQVVKETRPDGTKTVVSIERVPQAGKWVLQRSSKTDGGEESFVEHDTLGRPVRHTWFDAEPIKLCTPGLPCPWPAKIVETTTFDDLGERIAKRTLPAKEATPPALIQAHHFTYDAIGRLATHTQPWGTVFTYDVQGRDVLVSGAGVSTFVEHDALGRPTAIEDAENGVTSYTYGPFGEVIAVVAPGDNQGTVLEHDALGRVILSDEPDRGVSELHYNGHGELLSSIDAAGRQVAYHYDAIGREIQREDDDGVTTWTWDVGSKAIGHLSASLSPDNVGRSYTYDALARPFTSSLTLDGETFTTSRTYDAFGRVKKITYPNKAGAFAVNHAYDAHGNLVQVQDAITNVPYWWLTATDQAGRISKEGFGNDVSTDYAYDLAKEHVSGIVTTRGAAVLQNLAYTYDSRLNLTKREDKLQNQFERFVYDKLDRLTCAHFEMSVRPKKCAQSFAYAPNGNITSAGDAFGQRTYHYSDPLHPHAVTSVGANAYTYDAVGNQITRPGITQIAYTAFDLPKMFSPEQGGDITLDYDAAGRRARKVSTATTVYLDELYERVSGGAGMVHRYYVHGPDRSIAVVERTLVGGEEVNYLHADHLGSTDVVTRGPGSPVERRSYDAFGRRRNVIWKQAAPASFPEATSKGYTGHESDTELGLINARGRIYDPALRRFLTPDPIVAHPELGQGYNPFSYVRNNPLGFTDPSGFQEEAPAKLTPEQLYDDGTRRVTKDGKTDFFGPVIEIVAPKPKEEAANVGAVQAPGDVSTIGNIARIANRFLNPELHIEATSTGGKVAAALALGLFDVVYGYHEFALNMVTGGGYGLLKFGIGLLAANTDKRGAYAQQSAVRYVVSSVPYVGTVLGAVDVGTKIKEGDIQGAVRAAVPVVVGVVTTVVTGRTISNALGSPKGTAGGQRSGKRFTPAGLRALDAENAAKNGGVNRCESCGRDVAPGQRSTRGVRPPNNQRERDHIIPKSLGGDGSPRNGQILCRECNLDKSDKMP